MGRFYFRFHAFFLVIIVIGCIFAGSMSETPAVFAPEQPDFAMVRPLPHSIGTWWWNASLIKLDKDRYQRLEFLQDEGVSEIYLFYGGVVWDVRYRLFIRECRERGIRVSALGGDAGWLSDEGFAGYQRWLAKIARYQAESSSAEKFYGLHLDFEPAQDPAYAKDPSAMSHLVARVYDLGRQFCDNQGIVLEADVSLWIDDPELLMPDGEEWVTLGEFIARRVDTLSIMAYRDNADEQFQYALPMIGLARRYSRTVMIGSETGRSTEAEFVTFFEEGRAALKKEQRRFACLIDSEGLEYGFSVHDVESWLDLKD